MVSAILQQRHTSGGGGIRVFGVFLQSLKARTTSLKNQPGEGSSSRGYDVVTPVLRPMVFDLGLQKCNRTKEASQVWRRFRCSAKVWKLFKRGKISQKQSVRSKQLVCGWLKKGVGALGLLQRSKKKENIY